MADYKLGYSSTVAPLAVKDKIILGAAGGEFGIRGFIDAYDAKTGKRAWRFDTIPGQGDPEFGTWESDSWKTGSAAIWTTGSYDPATNTTIWGTGIRSRTGTGTCAKGTTCTRAHSSRWTRTRARSAGTSNSLRMTRTTDVRRKSRC